MRNRADEAVQLIRHKRKEMNDDGTKQQERGSTCCAKGGINALSAASASATQEVKYLRGPSTFAWLSHRFDAGAIIHPYPVFTTPLT